MALSMKLNKENELKRKKKAETAPACSAAANSQGFGAAAGGFYARHFSKVENITIRRREPPLVSNEASQP